MPRICPIPQTYLAGSYECRPEKSACYGQYIASKKATAFPKPSKLSSVSETVEFMHVKIFEEYETMLQEQKLMLAHRETQEATNHDRSMDLNKLQDQLRNRIINADTFIRECKEKRNKAEDAVEREAAHQKELNTDMKRITNSIKILSEFRTELKATVDLFKHYSTVIDEVIKISSIYESQKDCIQRCDALMLAQDEINALIDAKLKSIEEMRKQMIKITDEAALAILGFKTSLSVLERSYNKALMSCLRMEKVYGNVKTTIIKNTFQKESSREGVIKLCEFLCMRRGVGMPFKEGETIKMLNFINYEVIILKELLAELDENENENFT